MIKSRYAILALLTALNLVNYLDRFLVMAVSEKFGHEFGLTDGERGWVVTAFMFGYMLTSPIFGSLGDRRARKGLIALGVALWSIATVLSGRTDGFWSMFAARVAVGVGEASYATLSPTIIDDIAPKESKSRWLAIFYSAIPIGSGLGYVLGGVLEPAFTWRGAFYVCGGPGLLLALVTLLMREPERAVTAAPEAEARTLGVYGDLFRNRQYRYTVMGYIAQTFALGGFTEWAAPFLSRKLCLELATGNKIFGGITVLTGLFATAAGGVLADRVKGSDRTRAALKVCAWSSVIAAPLAAAALLVPTSLGQGTSQALFFVALGACEVAIFVSVSPVNAAVLGSVPTLARANAMAASIFAIHLLGDLISPPAIGTISDRFHDAQAHCKGAAGLQMGMYLLPIALAISAALWFRGAATEATVPVTRPGTA